MIISKKAIDQLLRLQCLDAISYEDFGYGIGKCLADCFIEHAGFDYDVNYGLYGVERLVTLHVNTKSDIAEHMVVNGITDRLEELGVFDSATTERLLEKVTELFSN